MVFDNYLNGGTCFAILAQMLSSDPRRECTSASETFSYRASFKQLTPLQLLACATGIVFTGRNIVSPTKSESSRELVLVRSTAGSQELAPGFGDKDPLGKLTPPYLKRETYRDLKI